MIEITKDLKKIDELLELDNSLFEQSKYTFQQFHQMFQQDEYKIWIYAQEKIVAYAIVYKNFDFYELFKIGVSKEFQNTGIGSQLLMEIKKECGSIPLKLEVSSKNLNAIAFYKNMGFKKDGLRKNYYGQNDDGILMEWCSDFSI